MLISIFADASFRHGRPNIGGYGIWLKRDGVTFKRGGPLSPPITNSVEAETRAIANAIASLRYVHPAPGDDLLIQSDCTAALGAVLTLCHRAVPREVKGDRVSITRVNVMSLRQREAVEYIREHTQPYNSPILRHVRGHTDGLKSRHWVNNLCDKLAREGMGG